MFKVILASIRRKLVFLATEEGTSFNALLASRLQQAVRADMWGTNTSQRHCCGSGGRFQQLLSFGTRLSASYGPQ
jgi:hypothetical protein